MILMLITVIHIFVIFPYLLMSRSGSRWLSFSGASLDGLDLEHDTLSVIKVIRVVVVVLVIIFNFFTTGWTLSLSLEEVLGGDLRGVWWSHDLL